MWSEIEGHDLILVCMCGHRQFVATRAKPVVVEPEDREDTIRLPRRGSNLWATIMVLAVLQPASSAAITQRLGDLGYSNFNVSDVSSYLTILRSKGLVLTTDFRRGILGGSTWRCTDTGLELMPPLPNGVGRVLALGVRKKHVIQIGPAPDFGLDAPYTLTIHSIRSFDKIIVDVNGPGVDKTIEVMDTPMVEALPGVKLSCGASPGREDQDYAKLVIDARREISIRRLGNPDDYYEQQRGLS